jgi:hypothetical protein
MAKTKKRPRKSAKAALKTLNDSKLLAAVKTVQLSQEQLEFKSSRPTPRTAGANKSRPDKKRG